MILAIPSLLLAVYLPASLPSAQALSVDATETHDYDDLLHGTPILDHYRGYFYTGQAFCDPVFNTADYPPTSGACVAWDTTNGFNIWVVGDQRVLTFEADFATGPSSLNPAGVVINAYDRAGVLVDQNSDCVSGLGFTVHCKVSAESFPGGAGEIGRIQVVASAPGYWTLDTAVWGITTDTVLGTVSVSAPPVNENHTTPVNETPYISLDQPTPPVGTPATCTVEQCNEGVQVNSTTVDPEPTGPIATPYVPETDLGIIILDEIPSRELHPGYDHPPETVGPVIVPPICALPFVCMAEQEIIPADEIDLPDRDPMPLPTVTIKVESVNLGAEATPHLLQVGTLQPIRVEIGEVGFTLCPNNACYGLIPPSFATSGYVKITVRVGNTETTQEIKPEISF